MNSVLFRAIKKRPPKAVFIIGYTYPRNILSHFLEKVNKSLKLLGFYAILNFGNHSHLVAKINTNI